MSRFKSRADYDAHVATWPKDQQWQWWPVPWEFATWRERLVKFVLWIAGTVIVIAMFFVLMAIFGMTIETATQRNVEHDRCMKHATNGYDIERCR